MKRLYFLSCAGVLSAILFGGCPPVEFCGDGVLDNNEACDDGNNIDGDGCNQVCIVEGDCGDGILDVDEGCDDGNNLDGDGCKADCSALEVCGDAIVDAGEICDEGTANGDINGTCTANCQEVQGTYDAAPSAVAIVGDLLFVGLIEIDDFFNPGDGFIAVIDRNTNQEINRIPTSAPQPQFFAVEGDELYVVNSGAVDFSNFPQIVTKVTGSIDVISIETATTASAPVASISIGVSPTDVSQGALNRFAIETIDNTLIAAIGSSLTGDIYTVDLSNRTVLRGADNPIRVFGDADLLSVFTDNEVFYVTSFTTDTVCISKDLADFSTCTELGIIQDQKDPNALEGLKDIAFTNNGAFAAIFSVASAYASGTVDANGELLVTDRGATGVDPERAVSLFDTVLISNALDNNILQLDLAKDGTPTETPQFIVLANGSNPRDIAIEDAIDAVTQIYIANQAVNTVDEFNFEVGGDTPIDTITFEP